MKKYIIPVLSLIIIIFTSCEDYLSTDSPSTFDSDYVFSNTTDAKKSVMAAYSCFGDDRFTSRMSCVWQQNTDVEAIAPSANPDGSRRDIWSLQSYNLTSFSDIYKGWNLAYLAIDRANQCIEGIKASDISSEADMQQLLGESYCLRAFWYYFLCNYWGDVPYFTEAAKSGMELDVPKTDKNVIYTSCIQDLINCEENMYFADEYSDGIERMNREFAMGMIARLALFRAGYGMTYEGTMKRADDYLDVSADSLTVTYTNLSGEEVTASSSEDYYKLASNYCQKLISQKDRELNSDFAEIFMNECEYITPTNDDVLYEVAFLQGYGGDVGWCIGIDVSNSSYGSTTIQVNLTPTYYLSFDDADKRRDVTISKICYDGNNDTWGDNNQKIESFTSLTVGKWNRLWLTSSPGESSSKGTGINWPLMRYSDILLMLAEAENEINNGPNATAINALTRVRARAFDSNDYTEKVTNYIGALTSKEDFFNAIVDERAWEFGGECLRKFDLVRWNLYGQKIVETYNTLNNMGKAAYELDLDDTDVAQYSNYAPKVYYQKDNGTLVFLNVKYEAENPPETTVDEDIVGTSGNEDSYASKSWLRALYEQVEDAAGNATGEYEPANYTLRCWRGYLDQYDDVSTVSGDDPVPYLLPISSTTVANSEYLNNNGYNLGLD